MKRFATIMVLVALTSCDWLGSSLSIQTPGRGQKRSDPSLSREQTDVKATYPFSSPDTTLYFSAVSESTHGRILHLFRNWEEVLALPEGPYVSADDGMHHILDGHLLTECVSGRETVLCMDGKEMLRFPDKEILLGIILKGDGTYTLSVPLEGSGFVFRKNGNVLLIKNSGYVFGNLMDQSYGETGALYMDGAHLCFSYHLPDGRCFVVRDGEESEYIPSETVSGVQDLKMADGQVAAAKGRFNYSDWRNARLWYDGTTFVQTGDVSSKGSESISASSRFDSSYSQLLGRNGVEIFYNRNTGPCGVWQDCNDHIVILRYRYPDVELKGEHLWFNPCCGKILDEGMLVALNPAEKGSDPFIYWKGRQWSVFWLDGEITGLTVKISRTS